MSHPAPTPQPVAHLIRYRTGTSADLLPTYSLFLDSVEDLAVRLGTMSPDTRSDQAERAKDLARWRPLVEHLTATADQYWVAEHNGQLLGYARSILRDDVRELTDFFVSPQAQSDGVGRELLQRAMPRGARASYIIATQDLRAQALYHKLGHYQICAIYTFHHNIAQLAPPTLPQHDLLIEPITPQYIPMLAKLDQAVHSYRRDVDHDWLMANRSGFILLRDQRAVGYGYVGQPFSGPFVMIDAADYPAALAHAEQLAIAQRFENLGLDIPMLNRTAINYLLGRGYQMSPFFCFYMASGQPLHVDKTIVMAPMIII